MSKSSEPPDLQSLEAAIISEGTWRPILDRLIKTYGYDLSDPLLLLPELPEEYSNAFYAICHFVESESIPHFFGRLIRLSESMQQRCPDKLQFFIRRAIRSDQHYPTLLNAVQQASSSQRAILSQIAKAYLVDLQQYPNEVYHSRCMEFIGAMA